MSSLLPTATASTSIATAGGDTTVPALFSFSFVIAITVVASLASLFFLGALAARAGGAHILTAGLRVTVWSALAMAVTAGVGALVGNLTRG